MTPRPPAFVTAAARVGPAATFILEKFVRRTGEDGQLVRQITSVSHTQQAAPDA